MIDKDIKSLLDEYDAQDLNEQEVFEANCCCCCDIKDKIETWIEYVAFTCCAGCMAPCVKKASEVAEDESDSGKKKKSKKSKKTNKSKESKE